MTSATSRTGAEDLAKDVREGGAWTRPQRVKNALIATAVRVVIAVLAPLPSSALRALGRAVGLFALVTLGGPRRIASANLRATFPEMSASARRSLLRRVYLTLGGYLGDAIASLAPRKTTPLPIDDSSLALLMSSRGGTVFASAHLGPWEGVARSLVDHGVPLTVLAREAYDPRLSRIYDRLRAARGVESIYRGSAGAAVRIVRTLRSGGVLGIPMDLRSRVPSVTVPFLGRSAATPVGPARIALRTGARVVVGTAASGPDGSLRITCTEIPSFDLDRMPERERERLLTARINAELTSRILALPTGWVWMHDRFA
jgi:KDO2-lipid IV(A) lauroyltransferase